MRDRSWIGFVVFVGCIGGFWLVIMYYSFTHTNNINKRINECIDKGGVPVQTQAHVKGLDEGYHCLSDYKVID